MKFPTTFLFGTKSVLASFQIIMEICFTRYLKTYSQTIGVISNQ